MAETFYFEIIASDKKFYSGACEHVIFPAVDGLYGVLANHEDTVTAVVAGELRFKVDGEWKVCVVGEGFADVTRDFVVIARRVIREVVQRFRSHRGRYGGTPRRHRHHPCKRGQNKSRRTTQTETKPFAVLSDFVW